MSVLLRRGTFQAAQIYAPDFNQPLVVLVNLEPEFRRDLFLGGHPVKPLFDHGDGRFDLLGALALLPGRPVESAQAVEDRAADLVFRVGLQFDIVARIEAVDRGNQADRSGRDQIF